MSETPHESAPKWPTPGPTLKSPPVRPPPPVFQVTSAPCTLKLPVCLADDDASSSGPSQMLSINAGAPPVLVGPMICEQGPSNPSSPTTPRQKRPSPLTPEAMRRIHLLTADPNAYHLFDQSKLSPISPNYPTSDLGYSPRSSISLVSPNANFGQFRDTKKSSSDFTDADSDMCKDFLLSPGLMLSPAPFSPFSDSAFTETNETSCLSSPSMSSSLSTLGKRSASSGSGRRTLHFSRLRPSMPTTPEIPWKESVYCFEDTNKLHPHPSLSSNPPPLTGIDGGLVGGSSAFLAVPTLCEARNRSHSDGDMSKADMSDEAKLAQSQGQFKKRLLKKYEQEVQQMQAEHKPAFRGAKSESDGNQRAHAHGASASGLGPAQSVPAVNNMFASSPSIQSALQGQQFDFWMRNQLMAWQSVWYGQQHQAAAATSLYNAGLLPNAPHCHTVASASTLSLAPPFGHTSRMGINAAPGPVKTWRRSRSESDVQGAHVCVECGQAFGVPDRLAKHIASRHRDRSVNRHTPDAGQAQSTSSATDVDASNPNHKPHKCHVCPKSFGRSDMLTRHMRLHTGIKPYACQVCGQEFSRSDHLSTHQRTHTGEKPYQCPQCSYAASRRDMITRHMRTHSRQGQIVAPVPPMNRRSSHTHQQLLLNAMDQSRPGPSANNLAGVGPQFIVPGVSALIPPPPPLVGTELSDVKMEVGRLAGHISSIQMRHE